MLTEKKNSLYLLKKYGGSLFLYGPVASRRLGWSLGVDILPQSLNKCKFCTLDCVYCQLGSCKPVIPSLYEHIQPDTLLREIEQRILSFNETGSSIDYITLQVAVNQH